jgi:hypothetical protein
MSPRMIRRVKPLLACAVWLGAVALPPAAQAQDDAFRAGLDARDDKNWQVAATQMRLAIQGDPKESTRRVRSGVSGIFRQGGMEYFPHYFLGEALFNLQDCVGAIEAWSRSEQQGAIRSRAEFLKVLQNGYASCEAKGVLPPGKYESTQTRTRVHVTEVSQRAATVAKLGEANIELWRTDFTEQYERAAAEIRNAQTRLASAGRTRVAREFTEAGAAADRAAAMLAELESNFNAAIDMRRSVQGQASEVEQLILSAEGFDRAIDESKTALTPTLGTARQSGREAIGRARERLSGGRTNPAVLTEARALAQEASAKLKDVLDEVRRFQQIALDRRLTAAVAAAQEAFSFIDGAFTALDRLTTEKPGLVRPEMTTEREAIQRQVALARRRLDAARKVENVVAIEEATRLTSDARDRLNQLITAFGPVTITDRGVHPALEQGVNLFFAGEYQQALAALNPADGFPPDVPLQLHIHLFRAAALYALFVRTGEADQALRTQALAEVEQCKQLNPGFQPDPRAFSQRFMSFFQSGGAGAQSAAPAVSQR